jgi:hypothetical protein
MIRLRWDKPYLATEHARWLDEALEATKPNGLYYAFAEFEEPTGHLYTHMTRKDRVPLPPPGWAAKGELSEHGMDAIFDPTDDREEPCDE